MLSANNNELITRVGPGTPMGDLMRQYWLPACLSSELPVPDGDPLRVLLLGERLVAFRDTEGRVGLMPHHCPHKGASLFYGRNEEGGLRCVFHGWKFDITGQCSDMPNEPPERGLKDRVRARAYPCIERAGLVWTYMGPRETPPPMPALEVFNARPRDTTVMAYQIECNWLQAFENDLDITHFGFLHGGHSEAEQLPEGSALRELIRDRAPHFEVMDTAAGVMSGSYRTMPGGTEKSWFLQNYLFPFYGQTGVGIGIGEKVASGWTRKASGITMKVPMDDTHTMAFVIGCGLAAATEDGTREFYSDEMWRTLPLLPNTTDWLGRFRWRDGEHNDYGIDREKQRSRVTFTGLSNVILEDAAMSESMGAIVDRVDEHLGVADAFHIRIRQRLIRAARALAERATIPPGVDEPDGYLIRPGYLELPADLKLIDAAEALRRGDGASHMPELVPQPWKTADA